MQEEKFKALSKPQQEVVLKIAKEAERQGVDPQLAIAVAEAETGGAFSHYKKDKILTSPAGAQGLMQLLPSTVKLYNDKMNANIDPESEDGNIRGGVFILKDLLTKYKKPRVAVAMYNASPKANAEFVEKYDIDPDAAILSLRPETQKYSLRISKNYNLDDDNITGLIEETKYPSAEEVVQPEEVKLEPETISEEEKKTPLPVAGTTSKDRDINPIYGGVAGATAGVGIASPIAMYKNYYDLAKSATGMIRGSEPTLGVEPTLAPEEGAWGKKTGYGLGEGSTREQSQRYQRAMPKGKLARAYAERLGGTSAIRQATAQAQAEAQALAEADAIAQQQVARTQGPLRSTLGQVASNFMIPIKAGLAGFGTGFGALDAYNRARAGDTSGSVAAGTGALASALSPFVSGAGPLSMAIPIGLYARDKMTRMTPEQSRAYNEEIKRLGYDPSFNP
jgi:hypothetical protein